MTEEWKTVMEVFIASGAGAAVIVIIDSVVKYYLYKKRNFQAALSIQVALTQMLMSSLQIRQFYKIQEGINLAFYSQFPDEPEKLWLKFRHIDLPPWMSTFDIINSDWDFTQFLIGKKNKVRAVLKDLIPAKLGYQSLMFIVQERNMLWQQAHKKIEKYQAKTGTTENFVYLNKNLIDISGRHADIRLRDTTNKFIKTLDNVIICCNKAFDILSEYINENFCHYSPLTLNMPEEIKQVLEEVKRNEK